MWSFDPGAVRTAKACYYRIALDLIESYANDAAINGLSLDRHAEEQAVELFASNILKAGEAFLEGGEEITVHSLLASGDERLPERLR